MSRHKLTTSPNYNSKEKFLHLVITGTPGTGKSTLAKEIATLLNIPYFDLNSIIKDKKLYSQYDAKVKTYDVSIPTLEKYLRATLSQKQSYVLDSHLSHHLSKKLVSHVIVCTCKLKSLNRRLIARKYSKQKIKDNLEAEIFDTCATEAVENEFQTLRVDCTKKLSKNKIKSHLRQLLHLQ